LTIREREETPVSQQKVLGLVGDAAEEPDAM
jgi:hypothetical protein